MITAALVLVTIARAIAGGDSKGWSVEDSTFERSDAEIAAHLLQSVNGANDVVCAALDRAFNGGYWNSPLVLSVDASVSAEADETARWIGKNKIDRGALTVVRNGLSSADACTRRVASRIAGDIDTRQLHDELRTELQSNSAPTRLAAVMALGYAEQDSSLPILRNLIDDPDRSIRLAALWALGGLENEQNAPMLIKLLESSADAEIRRLAAWALGQLDD